MYLAHLSDILCLGNSIKTLPQYIISFFHSPPRKRESEDFWTIFNICKDELYLNYHILAMWKNTISTRTIIHFLGFLMQKEKAYMVLKDNHKITT